MKQPIPTLFGRTLRSIARTLRDCFAPLTLTATIAFFNCTTFAAKVSLDDAKRFAVENHPEIRAFAEGVQVAKSNLDATGAAYYPALGAIGGFQNQSASGSTSQSTALAYVYLNYNLFRGGRDRANRNLLESQHRQAEIRLNKAKHRIATEVEELFHEYLYHKELLAHTNDAVERNKNLYEMVKTRRARGLSPQSDVMEFEIQDSLLKSERISDEERLSDTRVKLKKYLGNKIGENIEPDGKLQHQHLIGNLSDYTNRISEENEAVLIQKEAVRSADFQETIAQADFLPSVDIEAHAGYEPLDERPPNGGATLDGMLFAKWELFSGFETQKQLASARAQKRMAEAKLKSVILDALASVEQSYRHLISIQNRVDLESQNRRLSIRLYDAVLAEYKKGVKSSGDIKSAAEAALQAHRVESEYKFDFLREKLAMERALGTEITTELHKAPD